MTEQAGAVRIDGSKGLWTLEEVQELLEGLGYTVEVQTPLEPGAVAPAGPELADAAAPAGAAEPAPVAAPKPEAGPAPLEEEPKPAYVYSREEVIALNPIRAAQGLDPLPEPAAPIEQCLACLAPGDPTRHHRTGTEQHQA